MIIVFGGSGLLGSEIINKLLLKNKLIIVGNKRYDELCNDFSGIKNVEQICQLNLLNQDKLNIFLEEIVDPNFESINGVVLNFAKTVDTNLSDYSEEVKELFDLNYGASANIFSFFKKKFEQYQSEKCIRIVNILSNSLKTLNASNHHYISSKAALESLSKYYAKNFAKRMIINNVAPGLMESPMTDARFKSVQDSIIKLTPRGRLTDLSEIAEMVDFLISQAPRSIIGQTFYVDGGRTI
jgi:3-oxoacyl-[acyl-carrier protein] reductase